MTRFSAPTIRSSARSPLLSLIPGVAAAASIAVLLLTGCATDPYILALQDGDFEAVRAQVETDPESATLTAEEHLYPLDLAAGHSRARIIRYLVEHGADPNHRNSHGKTPLFYVGAQFKHNERVWFRDLYKDRIWAKIRGGEDMSMEESAAVTREAVRAVHQKVREARSGETKFGCAALALLESGTDPNILDNSGHNALWYVLPRHQPVTFQILLEAGTEDLEPAFERITEDMDELSDGSYTRSDLTYYEKALVDYRHSSRFVSNFIAFSRLVCAALIENHLSKGQKIEGSTIKAVPLSP